MSLIFAKKGFLDEAATYGLLSKWLRGIQQQLVYKKAQQNGVEICREYIFEYKGK